MSIPRHVLIELAMLNDLEDYEAEAIVDMLLDVEAASAVPGEDVEARRASDRERQRRYRERAKQSDESWLGKRNAVFERDGYRCTYCGEDVANEPHCDHIVPLLQGGSNDLQNLTTACRRCNSSKAGRSLEEWGGPTWGQSQQQ